MVQHRRWNDSAARRWGRSAVLAVLLGLTAGLGALTASAIERTSEPPAPGAAVEAPQLAVPIPVLPSEAAAEVAALEKKIAELQERGLTTPAKDEQDAALDEAIALAQRVLAIREQHQGLSSPAGKAWAEAVEAGRDRSSEAPRLGVEWYEAVNARRKARDLRVLREFDQEQRGEVARAADIDTRAGEARRAGDNAKSEALYRESLAIRRGLFAGDHPDLVDAIDRLASIVSDRGGQDKAEALYREALDMSRRLFPELHPSVAAGLNNVAMLLWNRGAQERAEPCSREAIAICRRVSTGDSQDLAMYLDNLGLILQERGVWAEAESCVREALAMWRRLFPGDDEEVASSLNKLANILQDRGAHEEAGPLLSEALAMRRRLFSGDHRLVASSLNNLAFNLKARGALEEAEAGYREALEMRRRLFPGDHSAVVTSLNNLATTVQVRGSLQQAEALLREALAMSQRLFPGDTRSTAIGLNNLASVLRARDKVDQAEPLYRDALAMWRRLFPGDHSDVAKGLDHVAGVLLDRGALEEAEVLYRESLGMTQRLFPGDHPDVALSLNNLAFVLDTRGALDQAELVYRDALAMRRRLFPADHPSVAESLNNLASILQDRGKLEEAEPLYREALAMKQRLFPADHPDVALGVNNLASVLRARGQLERAEPLFREALAMRRRVFEGDHRDVVGSLSNVANVLRARGDFGSAEPFSRDALEMSERLRTRIIGGERQRAEFAAQLRLPERALWYASLLAKLGRGPESLAVIERGRGRAVLDLLERSGRDLVAQARALGDERAGRVDEALAAEDAARIALASSEALLGGRSRERKALEGRQESEQSARQLRDARLAEYSREIAELKEKVDQQRHALAQAGAGLLTELRGLFPAAKPVSSDELLAALEPGEVVVAFAWSGDTVMTLTAGNGQTAGVIVADSKDAAKALSEAAAAVRSAIASRPDGTLVGPAARQAARWLLSAFIPQGARGTFAAAERLIVVPDGPLHGIPLEALLALASDNDPLAALLAGKPITYAPSATMYARGKAATGSDAGAPAHTAAVILGDPVFDREAPPEPNYPQSGILLAMVQEGGNAAQAGLKRGDVLLSYAGTPMTGAKDLAPAITAQSEARAGGADAEARTVAAVVWRGGDEIKVTLAPGKMGVQLVPGTPGETLRSWANQERGYDALAAEVTAMDQVRLHGGSLSPLPGTRREAEAVAAMLPGSTVLLGAEATLPRLREAVFAGTPRIVHLATHGLTGNAQRPYDASLALTRPESPSATDSGFLTLDELMGKWLGRLRGCELVVLSACDTGRGVSKGDSVMALPIGFFAGGVKTVVASLWKVDDTATALLMSRFYGNLLGKSGSARQIDGAVYTPGQPLPKLAALREARAWLRSLTIADKERFAGAQPEQIGEAASRGEVVPRRGQGASIDAAADHPYDHPYYWSGFVLMGNTK